MAPIFSKFLYNGLKTKGKIIKIDKTRNKKRVNLNEEKSKNIYFCPYCKEINKEAIDKNQASIFVLNKNKTKYRCKVCEPRTNFFDPLKDEIWQGLSYNFRVNRKTKEGEVKLFIKKVIAELQAKGFSNRDINVITHFSRKKINEFAPRFPVTPSEIYSLKQFLEEILVVSAAVVEKILSKGTLNDIEKTEFVTKALLYGCTYDFIVQVIGISKGAISKVLKTFDNKTLQEIANNKIKRKLVLVDDGLEKRVSIRTREKK